jgi:hypothetical protein
MDFNQLAMLLRMQPTVDSAGQPIDTKRPIVFDKGGYEPHTELSMTATGHELGLPQSKALYNVPTIYNGQINDPNTFAGMNEIRKNVMKTPKEYKAYKNEKEAVADAIQRSKDIGNLRSDELRRAVLMQQMENM